jgi:hypothetical protein
MVSRPPPPASHLPDGCASAAPVPRSWTVGPSWTALSRELSPAVAPPSRGAGFLTAPHLADFPRAGLWRAVSDPTPSVLRQTEFARSPAALTAATVVAATAAAGLVPPSLAVRKARPIATPPQAAAVVSPKSVLDAPRRRLFQAQTEPRLSPSSDRLELSQQIPDPRRLSQRVPPIVSENCVRQSLTRFGTPKKYAPDRSVGSASCLYYRGIMRIIKKILTFAKQCRS